MVKQPGLEQVVDLIDRRAPFPIGSLLVALIAAVYLLNPSAGIIEPIPDNLPYLGNLDEGTAGVLLAWGIGNLLRWWRVRRAAKEN